MEDSNETQVPTKEPGAKVILATALAYWLVPDEKGTVPAPSAQAPQVEPAPRATTRSPAAAAPETEIQARPGDHAREIIARLRNGADDPASVAFAEAQSQREAGRTEDAYLLYFFAAKRGHGEAALALGTQTDPAYFTPENGVSEQADPAQAYKWYRMAADRGNTEAERRLAALLQRVSKDAMAGDEKARRLMLQWKK